MDYRLEVVQVPVSDVDRSKAFYAEQIGFNAHHDTQINDEVRVVQLTPPGSASDPDGDRWTVQEIRR
jgi:catechol 2,3-dioxygenase-like lactoylglutathione lyase family enzyme